MNEGNKALSEFIFQSKYSRYNSKLGRKETWEESVDRIQDMHIKHLTQNYPNALLNSDFNNDFLEFIELYKEKKVLGSQRGLQFGGDPILRKNCRLFNCSFTYCDRLEVFKEIEWVLLCGAGAGVSVEKQHVNKLPKMLDNTSNEVITYKVEDSIEGWANAIQALINYYFIENSPYPKFDYSLIRPSGSLISGGFLAPGPDGLRNSINKIQEILDNVFKTTKQLSSLNCTDIISHCADSVLSGGVRRSAVIITFDPDDEEMFNCKTGNWFYENPQRARFNMSAVCEREETSFETFSKIFEATKQYGEPGFYWRSDKGVGPNPCCLPSWANVLTKEKLTTIGDIKIGDEIWSINGWTKVVNKISQGEKEVYKYRTSGGTFYGTKNHKIISKGNKIEVDLCDSIDSLSGPEIISDYTKDPQDIMDGLIIGDGSVHKASNNLIYLMIGKNDQDYFNSEIKDLITKHRPGLNNSGTAYEVTTTITPEELKYKYEIDIPQRFVFGSIKKVIGFLRGLYTANGSVVHNRITYKTSSPKLRDSLQLMLSRIGIDSYYTTNKPKTVKFSNGEYECKESYDINISSDRDKFVKYIGFIQQYKNDKIYINPNQKQSNKNRKLLYKEYISTEEVFDIEVDNKSHTFWCNGLNISNCEIGFKPTLNGHTGWQFCNLITINGALVDSEEDFYQYCKAAATIGTIQATYNKFPFLGEVTEQLIKEDPLIGVSIGGIMNTPDILLNPEVLKKGATIVKEQNEKIANILGINKSSRCTAIKPDGNSSVLLSMTPGCHGEHAAHYIRRVQVNKEEEAGKVYKKYNPKAVIDSVWSTNKTDWCIQFPITAKDDSVYKEELYGTKQLEIVKLLFNNWIIPGMRDENSKVQNNVSNTVQVPDNDWEDVIDWVWENQYYIAGISFIPASSDTKFNQPPYTKVLFPQELLDKYGEGIIFASGLIVDCEKIFGDLWKACDTFNGLGEKLYASAKDIEDFINELNVADKEDFYNKPHSEWIQAKEQQYDNWINVLTELNYSEEFIDEIIDNDIEIPNSEIKKYLDKTSFKHVHNLFGKRDIMKRMKKYGDKYFNSNYQEMIDALKQVQLYHDWCDITYNYQPVDWTKVKWSNVNLNADEMAGAACSGGQCEITKL